MKKTAIITGASGQDAAYLAKFLLGKGYKVYGTIRRSAERTFWRLDALGIKDKVNIIDVDLADKWGMDNMIKEIKPTEFYNLAAMSFVGTSFKNPSITQVINGDAVLHMLNAIKLHTPETKFYQASTSEMYGNNGYEVQTESTPLIPVSPYGISKAYAYYMTKCYRESYGLFACNGILFNHESPLRGDEFVTKKITNYINAGDFQKPLLMGNMTSKRDWGFAGDYVKAMYIMMQQDKPDDFVIATNKTYTIMEFIQKAFSKIGIDLTWRGSGKTLKAFDEKGRQLIGTSEEFYRPNELHVLQGDYTKAKNLIGWEPETDLDGLIEKMII